MNRITAIPEEIYQDEVVLFLADRYHTMPRKVLGNPKNYEARSNIMWTATWALNGLLACGKPTDWMVQHAGTGGRRLYRRYPRAYALSCQRVLSPSAHRAFRRSDEEIPPTGNRRVEYCPSRKDGQGNHVGRARTDGGMANACPINESGYVILTREDVINVLRQSL